MQSWICSETGKRTEERATAKCPHARGVLENRVDAIFHFSACRSPAQSSYGGVVPYLQEEPIRLRAPLKFFDTTELRGI